LSPPLSLDTVALDEGADKGADKGGAGAQSIFM
jgi:hypothetical protein